MATRVPLPLLCLFALSWLASAAAQALSPDKAFHHYVRDGWSIEDGLPQITVRTITQDRDGYLWFGTQAGVSRFDGVRFTTYTPNNTPALPGAYINALLTDRSGRVWIATYKGLTVWDKGDFRAVEADAGYGPLDVQSLVLDANGSVLAGTPQGVFAVQDGALVRRHALPGPAQALLADPQGLWIGSLGGTYRIEAGQMRFLALPEDARSAVVSQLTADNHRLWSGTGAGLFSLVEGRWHRFEGDAKLARAPVEEIFVDRAGNLWVSLLDELLRLRDGVVVERVSRDPGGIAVRSAFEDREGSLWLGTQWNGVIRLWNGWTRRYSRAEGLHDPIVWSLARSPEGGFWVGTETGLSRLQDGQFQQVLTGSQLPHPNAYTLLAESGQVWIGTRRGLVVLRGETLETPAWAAPMAAAQINGIVRDRQQTLWFATTQGLFRLAGDLLVRFGETEGLTDPRVRLVLETRDGRLLVASQGGLYELRDQRLYPLGQGKTQAGRLDVTSLHELADGRLLVGSLADGVYLFDGVRWTSLSKVGGLPDYSPFFIADDGAGYLWVAGIRGVYRMLLSELDGWPGTTPRSLRWEMLLNERGERRGGQKGYCCNGAGNAKGLVQEGVLWLPSRDGVVTLSSRDVVRNPVAPTTRIERLQFDGQWHDADASRPWKLPQDARDLGFEFTVLSFQDTRGVDLRYRLQGYDRDWHTLDDPGRRQATYTNLPPGHYVFEVSGANNSGVWSPEPARLAFHIQPRFHETRLFLFLLGLVLLTLVYAGYRRQSGRHSRQRLALEQLVRQRTEALEVSNRRLEEASQIDALTGLRNRRFLTNQLPADLAYYERERTQQAQTPETLLFALLDIDPLNEVMGQHGAEAADHLLQQVAGVLGRWLRRGDYLARWSETEFLLVLRPLPSTELASLGHRFCHAVGQHAFEPAPGQAHALSCSIGLIECPLSREARGRLAWEHFVELAGRAKTFVHQRGGNGWAALRPRAGRDFDGLRSQALGDLALAAAEGRVELLFADSLRDRPPSSTPQT